MPINSEMLLVVADDVSLRRNSGVWELYTARESLRVDRYMLPVLQAFSTANVVSRGVAEAASTLKSAFAWVELVATVKALQQRGVLVEPAGAQPSARSVHARRFDSAPVHIRMLGDELRTAAFQAALRSVVRPEHVVVDIGTGTGVLAITAAMAGARHVYAIEATSMSRLAQAMVDANGLHDRVTVIEGHSFDVDLPERADVVVAEIIGDDPLGERIIPTFADARHRLLSTAALTIPASIQVQILPVEVPREVIGRSRFTPGDADRWHDIYGCDFGALVDGAAQHDHRVKINSYDAASWPAFSAPLTVADADLSTAVADAFQSSVAFAAGRRGSLSGILILFDALVAPGISLSTHPTKVTRANSWASELHLLARPLQLEAGEECRVRYRFDDRGSRVEVTA